MPLLSFHSSVSRGHVGNSALVPALQALGRDVWPISTVVLSNHPGHSMVAGRRVPAHEIQALTDTLIDLGGARDLHAVMTGYMGSIETAGAALAAVTRVKRMSPETLYICDPILGDAAEGLYVDEGLIDFYRNQALPRADLALPNAFELERLTGDGVVDVASAVAAAHSLRLRGTGAVVVTSVPDRGARGRLDPLGEGMTVGTLAVDDEGEWLIEVPRLTRNAKGCGDVMAGLIAGHMVGGLTLRDAVARAAGSVHGLLEAAGETDLDLPIVAKRRLLAEPDKMPKPKAIR
ncbi:MAG: pyridoxal kinase [Rhodospirillaceae bacterium]